MVYVCLQWRSTIWSPSTVVYKRICKGERPCRATLLGQSSVSNDEGKVGETVTWFIKDIRKPV